jgi:hypothetical protein
MNELTVVAPSPTCEFDAKAPARTIAAWADRVIQDGLCMHVARAQLLPRDGTAYAVLDARCYDKSNSCYRCNKRTSETLFMLAWRFSSSTRTLKSKMTIDGTPRDSVRIRGRAGEEDSQVVEEFVLHPSSSQEPTPDWRWSYGISFNRSEDPVAASIDVSFAVKVDKPKWKPSETLDLAVTVPPLAAQLAATTESDLALVQLSKKEATRSMDGMTALVVGESVKLLLKDGWEFLKATGVDGLSGKDDLIQLNIGDSSVPSESPVELIQQSIQKANIVVPDEVVNELRGLNDQLRGMSAYSRNLRSNLSEATTKADKADLETKIEINSTKMSEVRRQAWTMLQQTGHISLSAKDRRVG